MGKSWSGGSNGIFAGLRGFNEKENMLSIQRGSAAFWIVSPFLLLSLKKVMRDDVICSLFKTPRAV